MKWKVTAQFLIALLIVGIAINIINTAVMTYSFYLNSNGINMTFYKKIIIGTPLPDIDKLSTQITFEKDIPEIEPAAVDAIKKSKVWVQFIDKNGKEVESINKPDFIQKDYTAKDIIRYTEESGTVKNYNLFIRMPVLNEDKQLGVIMGIPRPQFTIKNVIEIFFSYFIAWDETKVISISFTLITVLLLGYIFGMNLTRPVVKVIDGIAALSEGNYNVSHPEKGLYKDVYISLNLLAKALQSSETERKKVEKMREEWITNISHDLKTPLSSIKGYGELLLEPSYDLYPEERKRYYEVILNKSNYMEVLLDDLKLTQKLKNDLLPLNKADINIVEVLREIVINILNDPRYEHRKIYFESTEENISFTFDRLLMQRTFTNIILNAVVHNPDDTVLWVRVTKEDGICVEVEDNGRGIPDEDLENLFERYYRGTNTETSYAGSGLGLAIAKQVIEAHEGRIIIKSRIDEGTAVKVIF